MTARPTPDAEHPVVHAYLTDLGRALAGADAGEREEVIAAVREHIEVALAERGPQPSADDVAAVLAGLGPVERIADGATSSGASASVPGGSPGAQAGPGTGPGTGPGVQAGAGAPAGWAASAVDPDQRSGQVLVVLAGMSLLLLVLFPILAFPLGLAVFIAAVVGLRRRSDAARSLHRIAALISGIVVVLGVVVVLGALAFTAGSTVMGDVEEVTEDAPVEQVEPTEPAEPESEPESEPETDG